MAAGFGNGLDQFIAQIICAFLQIINLAALKKVAKDKTKCAS